MKISLDRLTGLGLTLTQRDLAHCVVILDTQGLVCKNTEESKLVRKELTAGGTGYDDRLFGLVVRRPPREWKTPGSNPACAGIFRGRVIPVTVKMAPQWLPCQAPDVIGSGLGLVGPVSVYCD